MQKPLITPHKALKHFGTQRRLAEALGVTQQAVSKWKLARKMPRSAQLHTALLIEADRLEDGRR